MKPFDRDQLRYVQRLESERNRLAEWVAIEHRHTDLLERQLQELVTALGGSLPATNIADPIRPRGDGVNLDSQDKRAPPYRTLRAEPGPQIEVSDDWWPRPPVDKPALLPNAGHANHPLQHWVRKVLGIAVLGLERADLEQVVELIARQQTQSQDFIPLFLYDGNEFDIFRSRGYVFEWLPPVTDRIRYDGRQSWNDYLAARRALIDRKWGLAYVVCFGAGSLGDVVAPADWRAADSPPLETAA